MVPNEQGEATVTKIEDNILCLAQGSMFHLGGASISLTTLSSHTYLGHYKFEDDDSEGHSRYFFLGIALRRFNNSLIACKSLRNAHFCEALGKKALENLDLDTAMKAFQLGKNLAMVLSL